MSDRKTYSNLQWIQMCTKRCYFKVDRSTFLLEKQYDYFYCSSYTQYICQMRMYASVRKSQHKLKSVAFSNSSSFLSITFRLFPCTQPIWLKYFSRTLRNRWISLNQQYVEIDKNGKRRKLDFTGEALNTYISGNILTFGYNYLHLPSVSQMMDKVSVQRENHRFQCKKWK